MTIARIRPAHGGDARTIHELILACWYEAYTAHLPVEVFADLEAHGLAEWQELLTEPEGVWLAHRDGQAVGVARAVAAGAGHPRALELEKLYVREAEYGTGTAENLLEISIGDAPCQVWVADYNDRARAFYTKHGFAPDTVSSEPRREAPEVPGVYLERMIR